MNPCPILVGREQEMAALRKLLDAGGGVAVVSGEAGIGKSRLVREFAAEAAQRRRVVLWARPEEVARPGPYALIADLVESIAERGQKALKDAAASLESELFRAALGSGFLSTSRSIAAQIRGFLEQLGIPPVIALEDLHSADEASHSVLMHLVRSARDDGHIVVSSYRGELLDRLPSLARLVDLIERERLGITLDLHPLADSAVSSMLDFIAPGVIGIERERIITLGEGIPFFIEELSEGAATGGVPRTIGVAVATRLNALGPETTEVLEVASLMTGAIDHRVIALAIDKSAQVVSDALVDTVAAGFLLDRDGRLTFRHSLTRAEISSSIVSVQRAEIHRRLALAIEELHPNDLVLHSSALARHFLEAGDHSKATRYLLMAGERALAVAATDEARAHFSAALSSPPDQATIAKRGLAEVEFREGNQEQAARLFREVANEFLAMNDPVQAARTLGRLAWALRSEEHSEAAVEALDEALALVSDERRRDLAALLVERGQTLLYQFLGRFREARPHLERAAELARADGDDAVVAGALDGLAHVADWEGNFKEALRAGEEAAAAAVNSGVAEVIGRTHNNHAVRLASYGHPADGLAVLTEGRRRLQESFGPAGVGALDVSRAWISWLMGLPKEVADLTARGRAAWQRWHGYRQIMEIWAAIEHDQFSLAQQRLKAGWAELGGASSRQEYLVGKAKPSEGVRHLLFAEVLCLLHSGDAHGAVRSSRVVVDADEALGSEAFETGQGLCLHAEALAKVGDIERVAGITARLQDLLDRSCPYPYLQARLSAINAALAFRGNEFNSAISILEEAASLYETCANKSDRARCLRQLAEWQIELDSNRDSAIAALRNARELADECGAISERNHVESLLRSLGVRTRAGRPAKRKGDQLISPREAEVSVLVAAGETNAEIARKLFLSERTVQDHITNAMRKLDVTGRAGLAAWAVKQGHV